MSEWAVFPRLHKSSFDVLGGPSVTEMVSVCLKCEMCSVYFFDHTVMSLGSSAIYGERGRYEGFTNPTLLPLTYLWWTTCAVAA